MKNFLLCFLLLTSVHYASAQTLKSRLSYDIYSIDFTKKISNKVKIKVEDLHYSIPITTEHHRVSGYIEFDSSHLIQFRNQDQGSRYLGVDEISSILSKQLNQTILELELKQKYLTLSKKDFDRHIVVDILDIERLKDNLVRCHFNANIEFPVQVKDHNQKELKSTIKFKFKAKKDNFFYKSGTNKLKLYLNNSF